VAVLPLVVQGVLEDIEQVLAHPAVALLLSRN
jgi:hypothetical protein